MTKRKSLRPLSVWAVKSLATNTGQGGIGWKASCDVGWCQSKLDPYVPIDRRPQTYCSSIEDSQYPVSHLDTIMTISSHKHHIITHQAQLQCPYSPCPEFHGPRRFTVNCWKFNINSIPPAFALPTCVSTSDDQQSKITHSRLPPE